MLSSMTTDQKGAIAEACIAAAAMKLGIEVYRPVAEGGRYDMILDIGGISLARPVQMGDRADEKYSCRCCMSNRRAADGFQQTHVLRRGGGRDRGLLP